MTRKAGCYSPPIFTFIVALAGIVRLKVRLVIVHATIAPEGGGNIKNKQFLDDVPGQTGVAVHGATSGTVFPANGPSRKVACI